MRTEEHDWGTAFSMRLGAFDELAQLVRNVNELGLKGRRVKDVSCAPDMRDPLLRCIVVGVTTEEVNHEGAVEATTSGPVPYETRISTSATDGDNLAQPEVQDQTPIAIAGMVAHGCHIYEVNLLVHLPTQLFDKLHT